MGRGRGGLRIADQSQRRGVDLRDARLRARWADGAEQLSGDHRGHAVDSGGDWDMNWGGMISVNLWDKKRIIVS